MKPGELSQEDQKVLETKLDPALEKEAADNMAIAKQMYNHGFSELAVNTADGLDKAAEDKGDDDDKGKMKYDEKEKEEEAEKKAAAMAAFVERGFFDGLQKLGQDRHKDPNHYLRPFVEEKIAAAGGAAALKKYQAGAEAQTK